MVFDVPVESLVSGHLFWLIFGVVLFMVAALVDIFFIGGAAIGAVTTGVVLWCCADVVLGTPLDWGAPVLIWGAASLIGLAITRALFGRVRASDGDVNEAPYRGDKES